MRPHTLKLLGRQLALQRKQRPLTLAQMQAETKRHPVEDEKPREDASEPERFAIGLRRIAKTNPTAIVNQEHASGLLVKITHTPAYADHPSGWELRILSKESAAPPPEDATVDLLLAAFKVPEGATVPRSSKWMPSERRWEWSDDPTPSDAAKA
jgi:hypothetical protein